MGRGLFFVAKAKTCVLQGTCNVTLNNRLLLGAHSHISVNRAVITDIVSTMFNPRFVEELFKPQELYSKKAMRSIFEKLTHASIMRLNAASMDKVSDNNRNNRSRYRLK